MNSKNVKKQSAKALANVSLKLGKMSADSACCYIFHQPKMPETLRKMVTVQRLAGHEKTDGVD